MSTRSTYRVIEEWKDNKTGKIRQNKLLLMYVHFDGYPTGHPLDTAKWLASGEVVNGFAPGAKGLQFNGGGCLAAQLVIEHKKGLGGVYLCAQNARGWSWDEYSYDIIVKEDKSIQYIAYDVSGGYKDKKPRFKKLFSGTPQEYVKKYEEVEE